MRTALLCSLSAAILCWAAPGPARSQDVEHIGPPVSPPLSTSAPAAKGPCPAPTCAPAGPTVVNVPAAKIYVEMAPPEVVIQQAAVPAVGVARPCLLQRCCHHKQPCLVVPVAPAVAVQPMAAPVAAPMTFAQPVPAPMAYAQPIAAPMTYAPPVAAPVTFSMPAAAPMTYAPPVAAPVTFSMPAAAPVAFTMPVAAPVAAPAAATNICCGPCPSGSPIAAPTAAPTSAPGTEVNDALRKLSKSVELLTGIADRHTDVLQYQQQQLKVIGGKVDALEKWANEQKQPKQPLTPKGPAAPGTGSLPMPSAQPEVTVVPHAPLPAGPAETNPARDD
jgi:hypothetical protein